MLATLNETHTDLADAADVFLEHGTQETIDGFINLVRCVSIRNDPDEVAAALYWTNRLLVSPLSDLACQKFEEIKSNLVNLQKRSQATRDFLEKRPEVSVRHLILETIENTGKADSREVYMDGHFDVCEWTQALQDLERSGLLPESMAVPTVDA